MVAAETPALMVNKCYLEFYDIQTVCYYIKPTAK